MPAPLVAPLVAAGASLLGSGLNALFGSRNQKSANAMNLKLAKMGYAHDIDMWNRNNEYNSPVLQMQRLRSAGLNPNMVYGSGSVAGNTSSQIPRFQAPHVNDAGIRTPFDIPAAIGAYQDFKMRQAQIDNVRAQEENTRAKTISEAIRPELLRATGRKAGIEASRLENLAPYDAKIREVESRRAGVHLDQDYERLTLLRREELLKQLEADIKQKKLTQMDVETEKKAAEALYMRYRNQWLEMGITTSDDPKLRILLRMMHEAGITEYSQIGGFFKNLLFGK